MQVAPIKPTLTAPATKRLKLRYHKGISNFSFKFNLRRYTRGGGPGPRRTAGAAARLLQQRGSDPGRAVQVYPIKSTLKVPGTKRVQLKFDESLSNFAFKINLRRYIQATPIGAGHHGVGGTAMSSTPYTGYKGAGGHTGGRGTAGMNHGGAGAGRTCYILLATSSNASWTVPSPGCRVYTLNPKP